jgi:hypothetical protein
MEQTVVTCSVTITKEDDYKVRYADSLRKYADGPVAQDALRDETVKWLANRVEEYRVEGGTSEEYSEREARLLGRYLWTHFPDKVAAALAECLQSAEGVNRRVRLELIFEESAKELARLPWEFLVANRPGTFSGFIAERVDKFTLTRFMNRPSPDPEFTTPVELPLRVLLAICMEGCRADRFSIPETHELCAALVTAKGNAEVVLMEVANPTHNQLKDLVCGTFNPHVVHIVGHGVPGAIKMRREQDDIDSDSLLAESARKKGQPAPKVETHAPVKAAELKQVFDNHPPKLVILQTCYGDKGGGEADDTELYTVAQSIVDAHVPAVLAMQYDIEIAAADKFAVKLYERLIDAAPIDVAVGEARRHLLGTGVVSKSPRRAFGTPVIYLGHDRPLVRKRSQETEPQLGSDALRELPADTWTCPRCSTKCKRKRCAICGLVFFCEICGNMYENPLGTYCSDCQELVRIDQPPWPSERPPRLADQGRGTGAFRVIPGASEAEARKDAVS